MANEDRGTPQERSVTMGLAVRRGLLTWIAIPLLAAQVGCATTGAGPPISIGPELGTIGVVLAPSRTGVELWAPGAKTGAREGAETAMAVATPLTMGLWPIIFYGAGTVVVPGLGAAIGAIRGVQKAPPRDEVKTAEAAVGAVLAGTDLQEAMRFHVMRRIHERQLQRSVVPLDLANDASDESARYQISAARGIATLLEVEVTKLEVSGPWGVNPYGAPLVMRAHARLIRSTDGQVLHGRNFEYSGGGHAFSEWPDVDRVSERLRGELDKAYTTLAGQIVDHLFAPSAPSALENTQMESGGPGISGEPDALHLIVPTPRLLRNSTSTQEAGGLQPFACGPQGRPALGARATLNWRDRDYRVMGAGGHAPQFEMTIFRDGEGRRS